MIVVDANYVEILDSNIPVIEAGLDVYPINAPYGLDVQVQSQGWVYKSLKENNGDALSNTLSWKRIREVNYRSMFDYTNTTACTNADTIEYTLKTSDVDTLALFGLEALSVKLELFVNGEDEPIWWEEKETFSRDVDNWYEWKYVEPDYDDVVVFKNITMIYEGVMKLTIKNTSNYARCSFCVFGMGKDTGTVLVEPAPIISTRNKLTRDKQEDGTVITTNNLSWDRITVHLIIDTREANKIRKRFKKFSTKAALFLADEIDKVDLATFGYYKDFDVPIGLNKSIYQLTIEGVA